MKALVASSGPPPSPSLPSPVWPLAEVAAGSTGHACLYAYVVRRALHEPSRSHTDTRTNQHAGSLYVYFSVRRVRQCLQALLCFLFSRRTPPRIVPKRLSWSTTPPKRFRRYFGVFASCWTWQGEDEHDSHKRRHSLSYPLRCHLPARCPSPHLPPSLSLSSALDPPTTHHPRLASVLPTTSGRQVRGAAKLVREKSCGQSLVKCRRLNRWSWSSVVDCRGTVDLVRPFCECMCWLSRFM